MTAGRPLTSFPDALCIVVRGPPHRIEEARGHVLRSPASARGGGHNATEADAHRSKIRARFMPPPLSEADWRLPMAATATLASAGPQYMLALERANKVRLARAELKRRVQAGEADAAEVITECPWEAESMAIADLLMSQRRWGQTRCRKFLAQIPMSENKTIGSMTERQRRTLAEMLSSPERGRAWSAAPWVTDSLTRV